MPTAKAAAPKKKLSIKKSPKSVADKPLPPTSGIRIVEQPNGSPLIVVPKTDWPRMCDDHYSLSRLEMTPYNGKELFIHFSSIQNSGRFGEIISELADEYSFKDRTLRECLTTLQKRFAKPISQMTPDTLVTMDEITLYCAPGQLVLIDHDGVECAAKLMSISTEHPMFGKPYLSLQLNVVAPHFDGKLKVKRIYHKVPGWSGEIKLSEIKLKLASEEDKARLNERFLKYKDCYRGSPHYQQINGIVKYGSGWWMAETVATGRVLVDARGFNRFKRNDWSFAMAGVNMSDGSMTGVDVEFDDVVREHGHLVWPFLPVFLFRDKIWGTARVMDLSPVQFRDNAMDLLVLDPEVKTILEAITSTKGGYTDFIEGKGGGATILLDGPPGVGKTTTAEAVAEKYHRPLYMVSVGELGVHPSQLEENLKNILEFAMACNAVVLLDEGDIFLEERNDDILRNAMVGIFLRVLEYHNGLMFITTNRVNKFDTASLSRMALCIHYEQSSGDEFRRVWFNQLSAAGEDTSEHEALAATHAGCDGRRTKNMIRIAQRIRAAGDKRSIREVIDSIAKFTSKKEK